MRSIQIIIAIVTDLPLYLIWFLLFSWLIWIFLGKLQYSRPTLLNMLIYTASILISFILLMETCIQEPRICKSDFRYYYFLIRLILGSAFWFGVLYFFMFLFRIHNKLDNLSRNLSGSRIVLPVTLALIVVLSIYVARSYPRISCPIDGGDWMLVGMAQSPACIYPFSDGGESCRSSDECEGGCLIYDLPSAGQPMPEVGVCRYDTNGFGCYAIIEDGYFVCAD